MVRLKSSQIDSRGEGHVEIDLLGRVGPGTEPQVAQLHVERVVGDVHGAGAAENGVWVPGHHAIGNDHGQSLARLNVNIGSETMTELTAAIVMSLCFSCSCAIVVSLMFQWEGVEDQS